MELRPLFLLVALVTSAAAAQFSSHIPDQVFVDAAKDLRRVVLTQGSEVARQHVERCYQSAFEQELHFGSKHATCVTEDYLLTAMLAVPYDRAEWFPPKQREYRYEQLALALQQRIAKIHQRLVTPLEIVDDTRQKMFSVGNTEFNRSEEK